MGVYDTEIWQKLDESQLAEFLAAVNPFLEPVPFTIGSTAVKHTALDFYDEYELYQLTDFEAIPNVKKYVLYRSGPGNSSDVVPITWTNEPIYALNKRAPIIINEETVLDYTKFFFHYVRGRHGRFIIVEHVDDIQWKESPPANARKALNEIIKPIMISGKSQDGGFTLVANMVFKDSLFKTQIFVTNDGRVSLSNEEILVEGMPVLVDPV